jgi:small-conductance mechanosensitive channel
MEKWIVIGAIWLMVIVCLTLFVRGASPARNRAIAMARSREKRLKALEQVDTEQAGAATDR